MHFKGKCTESSKQNINWTGISGNHAIQRMAFTEVMFCNTSTLDPIHYENSEHTMQWLQWTKETVPLWFVITLPISSSFSNLKHLWLRREFVPSGMWHLESVVEVHEHFERRLCLQLEGQGVCETSNEQEVHRTLLASCSEFDIFFMVALCHIQQDGHYYKNVKSNFLVSPAQKKRF
jgi:hypothetical protein